MASRRRPGIVNTGFEYDDGTVNNSREDTGIQRSRSGWDRFEKKKTKIVSSSARNLDLKRRRDVICRLLVSILLSCVLLSSFVVSRLTILGIATRLGRPDNAVKGEVSSVDVGWVWSAFICIVAPSVITVVVSAWQLCFKNRDKNQRVFCCGLLVRTLVEVLHSVGTLLLVFLVLPSFRPVSGSLLLSLVGVVPSLLCVYAEWGREGRHVLWNVLNSITAVTYVVVVAVVSYVVYDKEGLMVTVTLPLTIVMISVKWWNNYTGHDYHFEHPLQNLVVSFIKIVTSFFGVLIIYGYSDKDMCIRTLFYLHRNSSSCSILGSYDLSIQDVTSEACLYNIQFVFAAIGICSSFLSYVLSVAACKANLHVPCFSLPIVTSLPATVAAITLIYHYNSSTFSVCLIKDTLLGNGVRDVIDVETALLISCVFSWILFCLVSRHVWISTDEAMTNRERLFSEPMYCNITLVESLALSRQRASSPMRAGEEEEEAEIHSLIPKVIVCATMWHETELEMTQVLKSIYRLDTDRYARSLVQERGYDLEVNIFLDDAFETDEGGACQLNMWCRQLIRVVRETHLCLREKNPAIRRPRKPVGSETPFGGRLVWRLPGGTPLSVYLKDRTRVRHKKRWSQVMYLYYLLGYRMSNTTAQEVQRSKNTYILALDGDVDFQEDALRKLLDRMAADPEVGAACGRIHPVGTGMGPILWYQKFEYAVSHWLQKATEHVTGCVLCSPGCFSLFRASALMDKDVIRKYATPSTQSNHFVQYDQGEDRWLCTLLLQRGHRIEYCAASDSFTFAPEAFGEFFNQRKRWSPSTMSNTLDLLTNWSHLTKKNNNISSLFLLYQTALMVCLLFTPGTIFLLILGAINLAFPAIPLYGALILNLILVGSFIVVCLRTSTKTQIQYAGLLSVFYILSMMVVLVGLLLQAAKHGVCSTTTSFLIGVVGIFFIAALLHPQEFSCIIAGVIFFFFTPTMSMLLIIYSLCNLNNVSWGTREAPVARGSGKQGVVGWRNIGNNLCRCLAFNTESEDRIIERLDRIERMVDTSESRGSGQLKKSNQPRSHWTDDLCFQRVRQRNERMDEEERLFWKELLEKYLSPEVEPVKHQDKARQDLKELRNKVCLLFLVTNSLLIVLVVTLQMNQGLSIQLPCSVGHFVGEDIEPISVVFMLIFGILLVIQFFGMLWHRLTTFLHIMATTEIPNPFKRKDKRPSQRDMVEDEPDAVTAGDESSKEVDGETKVRIVKYLLHHNLHQDATSRDSDESSDSGDDSVPVFDRVRDRLCEDIAISEEGNLSLFMVAKKLKASQSCIKKIFGHMNQNHTSRFTNVRKANRRAAPKVQRMLPTQTPQKDKSAVTTDNHERRNRLESRNRVSPTSHHPVPVKSTADSVHRTSEFSVLGPEAAQRENRTRGSPMVQPSTLVPSDEHRGTPSPSSSRTGSSSVGTNTEVNVDDLNNETKL